MNMNPRLINKRLVKFLMDAKGIDVISITKKQVVVQVSPTFTPAKAEELGRRVGQPDSRTRTVDGLNYIVFSRY